MKGHGVPEPERTPVALSPVYWAGASLKVLLAEEVQPVQRAFPGLLGRGLIEGGRPMSRATSTGAFPGLLGRGLIEGGGRASGSRPISIRLSPVYWAGASLKE